MQEQSEAMRYVQIFQELLGMWCEVMKAQDGPDTNTPYVNL